MRARYYEPTSGRFISEDDGRNGSNWFVYCANSPVDRFDSTGRWWELIQSWLQPLQQLLKDFGLGGLLKVGAKLGALKFGMLLEAISVGLMGFAYSMQAYGEVLQASGNPWARLAGAFCGKLGAMGIAVGLQLRYASYWLIAFGDGMTAIDFGGGEPPEEVGVPILIG